MPCSRGKAQTVCRTLGGGLTKSRVPYKERLKSRTNRCESQAGSQLMANGQKMSDEETK